MASNDNEILKRVVKRVVKQISEDVITHDGDIAMLKTQVASMREILDKLLKYIESKEPVPEPILTPENELQFKEDKRFIVQACNMLYRNRYYEVLKYLESMPDGEAKKGILETFHAVGRGCKPESLNVNFTPENAKIVRRVCEGLVTLM